MSRNAVFTDTAGILLAGTHPWSSSDFDSLLPRTLLPVAHRPLIWYGLSWLHREGVRDVAVCGNRETRMLQSRLARHVPQGMHVSYHQDPMPRGAAGSARDAALASECRTFVIADATTIPNVDLADVLRRHHESGASVTVVVHAEARRHGHAALQVPAGIYVFARRVFDQVPARGFCDIKEGLIPQLYAEGECVMAYETNEATPRVLDASTYMAVNEWMIERLVGQSEKAGKIDGYVRTGSALVHQDAIVAADAALVGPVIVGPSARILAGAVVLGPTSIGREATVAEGAFVSRCAVWRRSSIGERAMVDRCVLADDSVVEPGNQTFGGVVVADGRSVADSDWVAQQALRETKRPVSGRRPVSVVGARLGRLVFGAGWSRSPAAQ